MKDLTKYTPKTACKKLHEGLIKLGFDATLIKPEEAKKNGWGCAWFIICEEAPFEGLASLSLGGSLWSGELGYYDNNNNYRKPEFKITGAEKYTAECYNNWNIGFYPNI
tara:strand:- start:97 stop:423 length:327 start_codon:yes stop_codon:yes gene_type:complete